MRDDLRIGIDEGPFENEYYGGCLTPEQIERYVMAFGTDRVHDPEFQAMDAHVNHCAGCKARADRMDADTFGVDDKFLQE